VAVQWHPEALTDNDARTRRLFENFIDAGAEFKRVRPAFAEP
jgi:gamma-glutamyl-gamma-aminobutyrate hydrolase PuuD